MIFRRSDGDFSEKIRISPRYLLFLVFLAAAPGLFGRDLRVVDDVADPMTLDPHKQFSEKNHTICQQIFDGLIRFGPEGKIEPALAVSWERLDENRMRFRLRREVKFHNGEDFDSGAVKFSIERYLDPGTGFPARAFIDSIDRVETPDSHTVDIITKYPDGIILNRLAGFILIAPPLYIKEKGAGYFASHPVGTGAFVFKAWRKGEKIEMTANRNYWMKGFPKVDGLVFRFIPQEEQVQALFSGEVDIITNLSGTKTLAVKSRPGFSVIKKPSFYTVPPCLNISSAPLNDVRVRKALNYALNKESLIRYDLLGNGKPIATFSMKGEAGHNEKLAPYEFNLPKARELLSQAGYPGGFRLRALVKSNAERTAKIIASNLKKAGVILDMTLVSDADMLKEFASGKYQMAIGDVPDPMCHSYFIQAVTLYSKSPYALGGDFKFDAMVDAMVSITDSGLSQKKAEEIDSYVYHNALGLFTYQKTALYGVKKNVNFVPYLSKMPYFYETYFYENKKE